MFKMNNILTRLSALALGAVLCTATLAIPVFNFDNTAYAQERRVKTRPKQSATPQMSPETFELFERAQEEVEVGNNAGALDLVDSLLARKGLSSYEMAMGYQMRGFVFYQEENYKKAIQEYSKILQLPDIPYGTVDAIRYTVAQLLSIEGDYQRSLQELEEWFSYQPSPNAQAFFFKGQVHYQYGIELEKAGNIAAADKQFKQGIIEVETTINMAKADPNLEILENWYQMDSALYFQLENYAAVRDILEIMIVKWPRPQYWVQLSAMYNELGQFDRQLAVLDVAYRLGFLQKETNIVTIAQLYSINGVPYLAAKALEQNMKPRMVDGKEVSLVDPKDEKNLILLGQSYLTARDYKKATTPLAKAAEIAPDGKVFLQLGSVYSTLEDWKNASAALQKAIEKKGLDNLDQAYLYLGLAYVNFRQFDKAEEAFKNARRSAGPKDEKTPRIVNGWLNYIKAEKARLQRLAAAGITPQ